MTSYFIPYSGISPGVIPEVVSIMAQAMAQNPKADMCFLDQSGWMSARLPPDPPSMRVFATRLLSLGRGNVIGLCIKALGSDGRQRLHGSVVVVRDSSTAQTEPVYEPGVTQTDKERGQFILSKLWEAILDERMKNPKGEKH